MELLAPNGKPSNLTPEQYRLVRTSYFKKWFGDFEKIGFYDKLNSFVEINRFLEVRNYEIEKNYLKSLKSILVPVDNKTVFVYKNSYKHILCHGRKDEVFYSIDKLYDILQNSTYFDFEKNHKLDKRKNIIGYECRFSKILFEGVFYVVRLTIQLENDNDWILHDINVVKEESTHITVSDRLSNRVYISADEYKDRKIFEIINTFPENISKVVDENGEPMVVYHGTHVEFTEFKDNKQGLFFAVKKELTMLYGKNVIPVFLNAKNIDTLVHVKNKWWKDKYELVSEAIDSMLIKGRYDGILLKETADPPIYEKEREQIYSDIYVVSNPNQIKLADGTNTAFDGNNPDIRFKDGGNIKTDFNNLDNKELRKVLISFWTDFMNSHTLSYLSIGEENYVLSDEDKVFVIVREKEKGDFSEVEKAVINRWIEPYFDKVKKPMFAEYFKSYSISANEIILNLKGEIFKDGGEIKKQKSFVTNEGKFSIYDSEKDVRTRVNMFTVFEDKKGWIVRNSFVPVEQQKQGIATEFYKRMNVESIKKTGKPLRSTQQRILSSGEVVHELSKDGVSLWDSFVKKGYAEKLGDKNYVFKNVLTYKNGGLVSGYFEGYLSFLNW